MNYLTRTFDWFTANADALLLGGLIAALLVLAMLALRWLGGKMLARDPHGLHWKGVVGRVLCKTSIWFMVAAALDVVARYADMPPKPEVTNSRPSSDAKPRNRAALSNVKVVP